MKVRFINMRKYKMSRMPLKFYLPCIQRSWNNKIWKFTIFRDYGIEFDFRTHKGFIDMLLTPFSPHQVEQLSRSWNGGYNWRQKKQTKEYWKKIQKQLITL